jgi:hypothetical protein
MRRRGGITHDEKDRKKFGIANNSDKDVERMGGKQDG